MHFECDLPSYAEPVSADKLIIGEVYFSVHYADEGMLLPIVETLVFTGSREDEDGSAVCCFQDLGSHRQRIELDSPESEGALFYFQPAAQLNHIFEYQFGLDELIRCSLRRQKAQM